MDDLDALIERLEKETGPDRELDCRIEAATKPNRRAVLKEYSTSPISRQKSWVVEWTDCKSWNHPPRYTASIDAAMQLVPEGYHWEVTGAGYARVRKCWDEIKDFEGCAQTPAIALCIAALKARKKNNG